MHSHTGRHMPNVIYIYTMYGKVSQYEGECRASRCLPVSEHRTLKLQGLLFIDSLTRPRIVSYNLVVYSTDEKGEVLNNTVEFSCYDDIDKA